MLVIFIRTQVRRQRRLEVARKCTKRFRTLRKQTIFLLLQFSIGVCVCESVVFIVSIVINNIVCHVVWRAHLSRMHYSTDMIRSMGQGYRRKRPVNHWKIVRVRNLLLFGMNAEDKFLPKRKNMLTGDKYERKFINIGNEANNFLRVCSCAFFARPRARLLSPASVEWRIKIFFRRPATGEKKFIRKLCSHSPKMFKVFIGFFLRICCCCCFY